MNTLRWITLSLSSILIFSCSDDDGGGTEVPDQPLETVTFENLHAPQQGGQGLACKWHFYQI